MVRATSVEPRWQSGPNSLVNPGWSLLNGPTPLHRHCPARPHSTTSPLSVFSSVVCLSLYFFLSIFIPSHIFMQLLLLRRVLCVFRDSFSSLEIYAPQLKVNSILYEPSRDRRVSVPMAIMAVSPICFLTAHAFWFWKKKYIVLLHFTNALFFSFQIQGRG